MSHPQFRQPKIFQKGYIYLSDNHLGISKLQICNCHLTIHICYYFIFRRHTKDFIKRFISSTLMSIVDSKSLGVEQMNTRIIRTEFPEDAEQFTNAFMSAYELAKTCHQQEPTKYHFVEVEVPCDQIISVSFNGRNTGVNVSIVRIGSTSVFADNIGLLESTPDNYVMTLTHKGECIALHYFGFPVDSCITVSELEVEE